jgi:hypothetical protein
MLHLRLRVTDLFPLVRRMAESRRGVARRGFFFRFGAGVMGARVFFCDRPCDRDVATEARRCGLGSGRRVGVAYCAVSLARLRTKERFASQRGKVPTWPQEGIRRSWSAKVARHFLFDFVVGNA